MPMEKDHHYYQQLEDVVLSAPFPIGVFTGRELTVVLANKALIDAWGKGDDIIGRSYIEILPELQGMGIYQQLWQVLDTGEPYIATNRRVDLIKKGIKEVHYFNYTFTPLKAPDGTVYGVMNTAADVTELVMAKNHAAEAEEKLTLAIENAKLGTYEINLENGDIKTSGIFKEIWRITDPITNYDLIGKLHPDDLHIREQSHREAELTGKMSYELRIIHNNSEVRWLRINGFYIDSPDTKSLFGTVQDITEQKSFEEELKLKVDERTRQLLRSNESLSQFAHAVSHDLKEPLRKIRFFTGALNDMLEPDSKARTLYAAKIEKSAARMHSMIEDILAYSVMDAAAFSVQKIDLNVLLSEVLGDLELVITQKDAVINRSLLPDIQGAHVLLSQLFYNIIGNSLKFSREAVRPHINITSHLLSKPSGDCIKIEIADNGIGIEKEFVDKIFEPFKRLHSKDTYDGTGLGLSLCHKIVQRHNGTVSVWSEIGLGTTFEIILPVTQIQIGL
ncbi:PAS domain-containing protein [Flavobacterium sp. Sd200]|nr:PAS domain-containing protein [Flavobacterium sp. Sd200]